MQNNECSVKSLFSWVVQQGHHDSAAALLKGKGIVECKEHIPRRATLHYAASNGRFYMMRFVLSENGEEINSEDHDGHMALELAVSNGQEYFVVDLLSRGSMIPGSRVKYLTALELAAAGGYPVVVGHMIDAGVKVKNSIYGSHTLHAAVQGRHYPVIDRLVIA